MARVRGRAQSLWVRILFLMAQIVENVAKTGMIYFFFHFGYNSKRMIQKSDFSPVGFEKFFCVFLPD